MLTDCTETCNPFFARLLTFPGKPQALIPTRLRSFLRADFSYSSNYRCNQWTLLCGWVYAFPRM